MLKRLAEKIEDRSAVISVFGLGHVGLPLSRAFARAGFRVIGVDVNEAVVRRAELEHGLEATTDGEKATRISDFIIICVPTPLDENSQPQLTHLINAAETISKALSEEKFIILESTVYPGATEEILIPILEKTGLKAGLDFGLAYSPNRIDPGNRDWPLEKIPKVVAGINDECREIAMELYRSIINAELVRVSSIKTAEAVKLVENIFRWINIALANELSIILSNMGVDAFEVIDAAKTKPFGFLAHYPGIGVGGSCIPVAPFYFQFKAEKLGLRSRFIELAAEINRAMPAHALAVIRRSLREHGRDLSGAVVAILGLAYKGDTSTTSNSPAVELAKLLAENGAKIKAYDPYVSEVEIDGHKLRSEGSIEECIAGADCLVVATAHSLFKRLDLEMVKRLMRLPLIVDGRGVINPSACVDKGLRCVRVGGRDSSDGLLSQCA